MTKKEKKKNKERKFGALLLLLFLSVVLLATSTYAWFTANETVTISSLDIYVEASSGIQISTDAVNWKTYGINAGKLVRGHKEKTQNKKLKRS